MQSVVGWPGAIRRRLRGIQRRIERSWFKSRLFRAWLWLTQPWYIASIYYEDANASFLYVDERLYAMENLLWNLRDDLNEVLGDLDGSLDAALQREEEAWRAAGLLS